MKEIKLADYQRPYYWIKSIDLDIDIFEDKTIVESVLKIERNDEYNKRFDLSLDGVDLKILKIEIDNKPFTEYSYEDSVLTLNPGADQFTLKTTVEIEPQNNFTLDGLYKSGNIFCTQCEAEGFRRITFYQDRPDVMAKFSTIIKADKKKYPILLSNGNKIDEGNISGGRHFVKWEDPFKKPAYLFALVAGDLAIIKDTFKTRSNKNVDLEIYVDHGNEDKCAHAMQSLKHAMKWDEDVFGLEYDLDIYMIVAVDSFNMGAMENKGLNIFNSSYVLAKKETATDNDFQGIEAVIAHEYFHNWTGNRVTCRDWFQLTLKEGLTVFRDQEFSSDMLSRPVKRIEDVTGLRSHQFPEDAGPMSHPIKPKSYIEINNFYTSTIYEKGAEVIRMIHTLIGKDHFRSGMDLYFERHDGQAVTTEDFVSAMQDASGVNLEQFKTWYDQNGTPVLKITSDYKKSKFSFTVNQVVNTNNQNDALHMPFSFSLYDNEGKLQLSKKIELTKKSETFTFDNIDSRPVASWNTNFSAPVVVEDESTRQDLMIRMAHDQDPFNQYDAAFKLYFNEVLNLISQLKTSKELKVQDDFIEAFGILLNNNKLDDAFRALAISLPSQMQINQKLSVHDYENVKNALSFLKNKLATFYYKNFLDIYKSKVSDRFELDANSMGARTLKKVALNFLSSTGENEVLALIEEASASVNNMNDELLYLSCVVNNFPNAKEAMSKKFYEKWNKETLVMQKWLGTLAADPTNTIEDIIALENLPIYDSKIPNLVRSVNRGFIGGNPALYNSTDGSGYKHIATKILVTDKYNPSLASRMATSLNHGAKLDPARAGLLKIELQRLMDANLSKDTFEIVSKNLKGL
jgi:aminopeptidase N